ncbi:MAG TPA: metallophosphoesterase [Casimicrobiaceae bacterium]|nr:metallophosphoesterase [Casimicrobiaceae bacterium]
MKRWALVCALAAFLAACTTPMRDADRSAAFYAYVVLGAEGRPVARVITAEAACPAIDLDGVSMPMDVRASPATIPLRPTLSPPAQSKPSAFPVLTCEKTIPVGVVRATVLDRALPLPVAHPRRIVVIGDTGCRIKAGDNAFRGVFQACNDPALWPFPQVARAAADVHPDLVIHAGDYHYRENACPAGNAGCAASPWGYGWDTWEADVFAPAAKLFAAAPWIVVRGNHESCNRAGQGWWRFLDPRPLAPRRDCNVAADDDIGDYSDPYAVPYGSAADADTQFIVFDSSKVGVMPLAANDPMYILYRAEFESAFALAARRPNAFFINHHPTLAFAPNPAKPLTPYPGNGALQSVLTALQPATLFPPSVQAVLSGHVHLFQVVTFATPQPPQFVAGNGGDWVDTPLPIPLPPGTTPLPGAVVANIVASNRFGFMTIERDGARWRMIAHDVRGAPMTTCTLAEKRASCDPIAP